MRANFFNLKPNRAVFTWLSKGIGFGFGFGFTTPFGWLVYLLWFWFYDSQVKTALNVNKASRKNSCFKLLQEIARTCDNEYSKQRLIKGKDRNCQTRS